MAIVPQLEPSLGWRAPYASGAAIAAVLVVVVAAVPRCRGSRIGAAIVLDRQLVPHGLIHAASFGVSYLAASWIVPLLERHGTDRGPAAAIGALVLLGGVVTRIGGGFLLSRAPGRRALRSSSRSLGGAVAGTLLALPAPLGVARVRDAARRAERGPPVRDRVRRRAVASARRARRGGRVRQLVRDPAASRRHARSPALPSRCPATDGLAFAAIAAVCLLTLPAVRRAYLPEIGTKSRTSSPV